MSSVFPLEIEETILDLLAEDDKSHSALKTCSLVCQAFLPICRKHIFRSIFIDDYTGTSLLFPPSIHAFERLLHETPEIADYIRELDYSSHTTNLISPSIQKSLKRISRLEFLTVRYHLDWSNKLIRPALLHLLHLPTLTHFKMNGMKNFVVSDLLPCVNLKYLDIGVRTTVAAETTFPAAFLERSVQLNEFAADPGTSAAIMKLCTAQRPNGQPIIDFGSLSKITVVFETSNDGEALRGLFRRCHVLTDVDISFWKPRFIRPSLADMLRPSMQTLKHIVVNIDVNDIDEDPLSGFHSELEDMRTKNVIETVTITIMVEADARHSQLGGDDWGRLDEVLTTPGWFSLKRVSLAIEMNLSDNELEEAEWWKSVPETLFPRLLSSNSVSFDLKIIPDFFLTT